MTTDYFIKHRETVQVASYALYDTLHALMLDGCKCVVSKEDGHLVVHYCKRPTASSTVEPAVNDR